MIILCEQCKKKFEVDANLIPKEGRLLECSSCNHQWFYKNISKNTTKKIHVLEENTSAIPIDDKKKSKKIVSSKNKEKSTKKLNKKSETIKEENPKKNIAFLNLILVFIITFISFLLLVETFKSPLKQFIPNIDLILNSLYESFKDIYLFTKDLI